MKARVVLVLLVTAALPGCFSTHNTTLARQSGDGQVIYRLSEEQAFGIAIDAFADVMPSEGLFDVTVPRRGYQATYRAVLSTYSQRGARDPAIGTDAKRLEMRGYTGLGSAALTGSTTNRALYRRLAKHWRRPERKSSSPTFETVSTRPTGARTTPEGGTPAK